MKIVDVRSTAVRVPLSEPVKWSGGTRGTAPALIVEIETDSGIVGLGECAGPHIPVIRTAVDAELRPLLIGQDPLRTEFLLHRMDEHVIHWFRTGNHAIAGLEMALLDIKAKYFGASVCDMLGGRYRDAVDYMGYLFIDTPERNAAKAKAYVDRGFRSLKVKVGRSIEQDAASIAAIRDAVGPDVRIRIDANQGWSVPTAIKAIRAMEPYGLEYVEQPVTDRDFDGMAQVARAVATPVAADESCKTVLDALQLAEKQACGVFVIYVSEAGGLLKSRQIADIAYQYGITCVLGTWTELGIGTLAGAHLIASHRSFTLANDTHYPIQQDDVITDLLRIEGGTLRLPEDPGLGATLDRDKLAIYANYPAREAVHGDPESPDTILRRGQIL
ncbi:MAG: hypothetical protein F4X83_08105 [Chloroflexi bacterium]|nr:hypothetical protein [Chloroflexota bacterium]